MLQHISFKDWNPIGKPSGKKNNSSGEIDNKKLADTASDNKELTEQKNQFGEAATLELSQGFVRSNTPNSSIQLSTTATTRTLKVGCSGADVTALQNKLNYLGYNCGNPDGKFGNGTKNVVISFQKTYGLTPDGIVGNNTLNAINTTVNRKNKNILSKGQVSDDVKKLQENLISLGYLSGKADRAFGTKTESAVKAFQNKYGLTPDGLVGSETKAKIASVKSQNEIKPVNPAPTPILGNIPQFCNHEDLGYLSGKYESRGDCGTISTGKGDAGGKSYGIYQFALNAGTPKKFVDWLKNRNSDIYKMLGSKP